jgi:hypothetical protein
MKVLALLIGLIAGMLAGSWAMAEGTAVRFESGGVGQEEFSALKRRAGDYSLELLHAVKGSGEYLADVDVEIRELPQRALVLRHRTDGPLLLADLPAGRYELTSTYGGAATGAAKSIRQTIVVPRGGRMLAVVVYFDA